MEELHERGTETFQAQRRRYGTDHNTQPYYISPDILTQPHNYDEKTDVWSLGVLLYVLTTATPPFDGPTEQAIFKKITNYSYALSSTGPLTQPRNLRRHRRS